MQMRSPAGAEPMSLPLLELPPEILRIVTGHLLAVDLLSLAACSRACRAVAGDETIWETLLARTLAPMVQSFFDGNLPKPPRQSTWKRYYFELSRDWKRLAQERTGKLLVQIGEQKLSGRGPHDLIPLFDMRDCWPSRPKTYGIYDVTKFIDLHPGADLIIKEAADEADSTCSFEMNGHSDEAVRRLRKMAVPGLEALPYDHDLDDRRRARLQRRYLRSAWPVAVMLGLAMSWSAFGDGLFYFVPCCLRIAVYAMIVMAVHWVVHWAVHVGGSAACVGVPCGARLALPRQVPRRWY